MDPLTLVPRDPREIVDRFVITDPTVLFVADCLRWLALGFGLAVVALYVRTLLGKGISVALRRYPGFTARSLGLVSLTLSVCVTSYDRIGDPVTLLLPINLFGIGCAAWSLRSIPSLDEPSRSAMSLRGDPK